MIQKTPDYLKLISTELETDPSSPNFSDRFEPLLDAFAAVTGWRLAFRRFGESPFKEMVIWESSIADPFGGDQHQLQLIKVDAGRSTRTSRKRAVVLAEELAEQLSTMGRIENALWQREAELATAVPVVARVHEDSSKMAHRLRAILAGGAQALSCQAAAVYLLDEATSELKLRSMWGLPADRFLESPRPLQSTRADLEALAGHVVALEETSQLSQWNVPEDFASAICVPLSSPTVPLGTVWMFSDTAHEFTDVHTNIAEIIAGRIATELEREVLLRQVGSQRPRNETAAIVDWQSSRRELMAPLLDQWQLAASTGTQGKVGNDSHYWMVRDQQSQLMLSLCRAEESGIGGAMTTAFTDGLLRSEFFGSELSSLDHASCLGAINSALWTSSAGDQTASIAIATLDLTEGILSLAAAGRVQAFVIRPHAWELISVAAPAAGTDDLIEFRLRTSRLEPGDLLLLSTADVRCGSGPDTGDSSRSGAVRAEATARAGATAEKALRNSHLDANSLIDKIQQGDSKPGTGGDGASSLLIAKRLD